MTFFISFVQIGWSKIVPHALMGQNCDKEPDVLLWKRIASLFFQK
jgi:hypothetical protein